MERCVLTHTCLHSLWPLNPSSRPTRLPAPAQVVVSRQGIQSAEHVCRVYCKRELLCKWWLRIDRQVWAEQLCTVTRREVSSLWKRGKCPSCLQALVASGWATCKQFSSECSPVKTGETVALPEALPSWHSCPERQWSVGLGPAPGGPGAVPTCAHSSLGDVSAGGKLTARSGSQACSSLEAFVCL